jgi:hypothetical protein
MGGIVNPLEETLLLFRHALQLPHTADGMAHVMSRYLGALVLSCGLGACTGFVDGSAEQDSQPNGAGSSGGSSSSGAGGGGGAVDPSNPGEAVLPGDLTLDGKPVYYRFVRLTHEQWENSVRDVLLLPERSGLSSGFVPDPPEGKFENNERALYVSANLRTDYQRAAETLAERVSRDASALARLGSAADVPGFINGLGRRAFRRALTPAEETAFSELFASGKTFFESGDDFADGAQVVLETMLQSPHFVYRIELSPDGARLSGYELAAKLSFLLRNTTPDEALLVAAETGKLDTPEGLASIAQQMLGDTASTASLERFHSALFGLERYQSILKDTTLFPNYTEALNQSLLNADLRFFQHVYEGGFGLREILTSKVAYVDRTTAGFYGISAGGNELEQVTLDDTRPGFLTRVGFLAYNATLRDPDPIHRGVDINNKLLCAHLEPPAGEIPPLPPFDPGQTNRERVIGHTGSGTCAGCHLQIINPLGFALENFDAMGQLRTTDNGKPVDTSGEYRFADGVKTFGGINELVQLIGDSQQAHGCYAANLTEFALARDIAGGEGELVTELQRLSLEEDTSVKDILLTMVKSPLFVTAKAGAK